MTLIDDKAKLHHLLAVLRIKVGEQLRLFNSRDGEWLAEVISIHKRNSIQLRVIELLNTTEKPSGLRLAFTLIKQTMFIVEKATELGVDGFIPLITNRCVVRHPNMHKLDSYIRGAVEQSERITVPSITQAITLEEFIKQYGATSRIIFCNEEERGCSIDQLGTVNDAIILIGPEGGFTEQERSMLLACPDVVSVSLTRNILKAETAAIFALSRLISI
jgi:16S rRNA (uracil1498-N3)-methyltransferase